MIEDLIAALDRIVSEKMDGREVIVLPLFHFGISRIGHFYFEGHIARSLFPSEKYQIIALHQQVPELFCQSPSYRLALADLTPLQVTGYFEILKALNDAKAMDRTYHSPIATYHMWSFTRLNNNFAEAIRAGLPVRYQALDDAFLADGCRVLESMGIAADQPLIALHVRQGEYAADTYFQAYRNADIQNYLPAIDHLTARGYAVIRLGDQSMPRLPAMGPLVVDAANAPIKISGQMGDSLLELYAISRSKFFMGMSSGPMTIALALNRPMLCLNTPLSWNSALPNPQDLIVFRHYHRLGTGEAASFLDIALNPIFDLIDTAGADKFGFGIAENPPDLIAESAAEMLSQIQNRTADSSLAAAQNAEFRRQADWLTGMRRASLEAPAEAASPPLMRCPPEHRTPTFALPWTRLAQSFLAGNPGFLAVPPDVATSVSAHNPGGTRGG